MNNQRRSFLRRAFGLAVAAPAISRIIANGGAKPVPPAPALQPVSVWVPPSPRFVEIPALSRAMTSCSVGLVWDDITFKKRRELRIDRNPQ